MTYDTIKNITYATCLLRTVLHDSDDSTSCRNTTKICTSSKCLWYTATMDDYIPILTIRRKKQTMKKLVNIAINVKENRVIIDSVYGAETHTVASTNITIGELSDLVQQLEQRVGADVIVNFI